MSKEPHWFQREILSEIDRRRKLKGWSNARMVSEAGVSPSTWDQIKSLKVSPQLKTVERILNVLHIKKPNHPCQN